MDQEILVKEALSKEMIEAGADLIHRLDQADIPLKAAMWLYLSEKNTWRLFLALPDVKLHGPLKAYERVQSVIPNGNMPTTAIDLMNISVVDTSEPFLTRLRNMTAFRNNGNGFLAYLPPSRIIGLYVEEAYIYRIA